MLVQESMSQFNHLGNWKERLSWVLCKIFLSSPISTSRGGLPCGPLHNRKVSGGFSSKLLPVITLNSQEKTKIKINGKPYQILVDTITTLSTLNPSLIQQKEVSLVRVSNKVQREFLSQPVQMTLGHFTEKHSFLLCHLAPINLLGWDLSKLRELIHFSLKGDLTLEVPDQPEPDLLHSYRLSLHRRRKIPLNSHNLIKVLCFL